MKIIIKNGYQYFDLGNNNYALVMDDEGNPLEAEDKEWVETKTHWVLFPKIVRSLKKKLH